MARQVLLAKFDRKRRQLIIIGSVFLVIIGTLIVSSYTTLVSAQQSIIETEAVRVANVVTEQAIVARTIYAKTVVDKLSKAGISASHESEGSIRSVPIPAQFLKLMAHEANEKNLGLYKYKPLSKWNLNPNQGLTDEFQRWAFTELEKQHAASQDKRNEIKPIWRIEEKFGERFLRFMTADVAVSSGCVSCHNAFEKQQDIITRRVDAGVKAPKVFRVGDIMGAIEATVPLGRVESLASKNSRRSLNSIMLISLFGTVLIGGISIASFNRERIAEQKAKLDGLTGLLNRTGFMDEGSFALEICSRKNQKAHLLYLDLNGFKAVNDTYGHEAGDAVLQEVGRRLHETTRSSDLVARLGGDEFAILMLGTSTLDIDVTIEKIKQAVLVPVPYGHHSLKVGTSLGYAIFPNSADELSKLMKIADGEMYEDKQFSKKSAQKQA